MEQNSKKGKDGGPGTNMQFALNILGLGTFSGSVEDWARLLGWIWPKLALMAAGAALTVAGLFLFGVLGTSASTTAASTTTVMGFGFVNPQIPVPYCDVYVGTGRIPAGDKVLIFDQPLTDDNQPNLLQSFYYDGSAVPTKTGWLTRRVTIGVTGKAGADEHIELLAILAPENLANYVQSIFTPSNSWWKSSASLPGLQAAQLDVVRNADNGC
jgi:hypothetical protein